MDDKKVLKIIAIIVGIIVIGVVAFYVLVVGTGTFAIKSTVNDVKSIAFRDSIYGMIQVGERNYQTNQQDSFYQGETIDLTSSDFLYKGKPEAGMMIINSNGEIAIEATNGTYCATKDFDESEVTITKLGNRKCDGSGIRQ